MSNKLSYWIDENNIIRQVDASWDSAMDSKSWSERASSKSVIGKSLFEFICDDVTRMYIAAMIDTVRVIPQSLFRPYRCDTPEAKRYMQMTVSPGENGWLKVSHEQLRIEPLPQKVSFNPLPQDSPAASSLLSPHKGKKGPAKRSISVAASAIVSVKLVVTIGRKSILWQNRQHLQKNLCT